MFSISFRKQRDKKKENNLVTLIIKTQILFAHAIITSKARASSVFLSSFSIFNVVYCESLNLIGYITVF